MQETIINGFPGLFFVLGLDGKHVRWNHTERDAAGKTNGAMPQISFLEIVASEDRKVVEDMIELSLRNGAQRRDLSGVRLADGAIYQFLLSGSILEWELKSYLVGFGIELATLPPMTDQEPDCLRGYDQP